MAAEVLSGSFRTNVRTLGHFDGLLFESGSAGGPCAPVPAPRGEDELHIRKFGGIPRVVVRLR